MEAEERGGRGGEIAGVVGIRVKRFSHKEEWSTQTLNGATATARSPASFNLRQYLSREPISRRLVNKEF